MSTRHLVHTLEASECNVSYVFLLYSKLFCKNDRSNLSNNKLGNLCLSNGDENYSYIYSGFLVQSYV